MRRPSVYHACPRSPDLNMTPMIDVVFQLLVFFIWTASFQMAEYVLPGQLSQRKATPRTEGRQVLPPEADFQEVVVRILWRGDQPSWLVNQEEAASLERVRDKLAGIFEVLRESRLIIHPDQQIPLRHIIDVYDLTRQVGFQQVQFAVSEGG